MNAAGPVRRRLPAARDSLVTPWSEHFSWSVGVLSEWVPDSKRWGSRDPGARKVRTMHHCVWAGVRRLRIAAGHLRDKLTSADDRSVGLEETRRSTWHPTVTG